jgi:hypothetical protein
MQMCGYVGLDELTTHIHRIALSRDDISTYSIKVDKAEFHKQLLKDVLEGITTVQGISSEVEGVLKSLSENIIKCQDEKLEKSVWAFINVLTWDDVTKEVKGCTFSSLT